MSAHINHQSAPHEARPVFDFQSRRREPVLSNFHKLQKSLGPRKTPSGFNALSFHAARINLERITFILINFLHHPAGTFRVNHKIRFRRIGKLHCEWQSRPAR